MTEEQIQKYEKWLDDNSTYDVILSAEILSDLKTIQQQKDLLVEGLKGIEVKLAYLNADKEAKKVVMIMIDELFAALQQIQGKDEER
ncbi:hypothetical protein QFZ77_002425 [Paenibacillus sp. V4I3]|uniref:hypothetical protein n=1 Tax=Paenibacillus sp. V4I3 TaxID=3042305 RepID=UPI00277D2D7D|nr:hypothetical protein [Paenibacillus sp. V4I3]MDQ0873766.1 hypothetical protein [Paenibacillus sp. V4I3]